MKITDKELRKKFGEFIAMVDKAWVWRTRFFSIWIFWK